jgi:hypothetical protein
MLLTDLSCKYSLRLKQIANPDCASHPAFVYRSPESWSLVTTLMNHAANEGLWDTIRRAFTTVLHLVSSVQLNQIKSNYLSSKRPYAENPGISTRMQKVCLLHCSLKGHGNEADFLGFLHKLFWHRSLTLHFEPFRFWLRILGDIRNQKTTRGVGESTRMPINTIFFKPLNKSMVIVYILHPRLIFC